MNYGKLIYFYTLKFELIILLFLLSVFKLISSIGILMGIAYTMFSPSSAAFVAIGTDEFKIIINFFFFFINKNIKIHLFVKLAY